MILNNHSKLKGMHAFLGASTPAWLNYNDEIFTQRYYAQYAITIGTTIHELAEDCIKSKMYIHKHDGHLIEHALYSAGVPKDAYDTGELLANLLPFINDAIGFRMEPEVILYYSDNCFGTSDALIFDEKAKYIKIHDLKTGQTPAKMEQLMIYCALLCLEYHLRPQEYDIELRIYQSGNIIFYKPEFLEVEKIMDLIIFRDQCINKIKERNGML